jgi:hypothetical protein
VPGDIDLSAIGVDPPGPGVSPLNTAPATAARPTATIRPATAGIQGFTLKTTPEAVPG